MNELAKIISVHKRSRSMHAIENFPHSCDISISRFISFFTYSSWVFYRVCPKITFKFKRRVKNLSGFYVFSVDFCCFCFGSNERICFCCSFFCFNAFVDDFSFDQKVFRLWVCFLLLFIWSVSFSSTEIIFSMWCHSLKLSVIKLYDILISWHFLCSIKRNSIKYFKNLHLTLLSKFLIFFDFFISFDILDFSRFSWFVSIFAHSCHSLYAKIPKILPLNDLKGDFYSQKLDFVMNKKFSEQFLRCD